jgi:hypothetical protein
VSLVVDDVVEHVALTDVLVTTLAACEIVKRNVCAVQVRLCVVAGQIIIGIASEKSRVVPFRCCVTVTN